MNNLSELRRERYEDAEPIDGAPFGIELRQIWAQMYRNRLIIAISMVVCIIVGFLYLILATPVFRASASVQIEEQSAKVLDGGDVEPVGNPMDADRFLQTQLDIVRSRSVAMAVAREQKLMGNASFLATMGASEEIEVSSAQSRQQAEEQLIFDILSENLQVSLPADSRIATISFDSSDPVLAARIANSFAESYIRADLQRKFGTSAYARQYLSRQLEDAKRQLETAERAALAYASREQLIDASNSAVLEEGGAAPKSLTVSRLVTLNSAYANAVAKRIQSEQRWRQAQGSSIMALPEVLSNQAIQDLIEKRAAAVSEYEQQLETRKEDFPKVRQARAQIDELNRQVNTLASNIRNSLRSDYQVADRQENSLRSQISSLESATLNEQQRNVELSILQRATETSRAYYDELLKRFRELSAEAGVQPNNIQLIDRAEVPSRPISPRMLITMLLSVVAGLVAGIAAAFVIEHLNDTVRSSDDVNRKLGLPLLGMVPDVKDVSQDLGDPKSPVSEAYNSIRASLLMSSSDGLPKVVAVTSVQPSEGKTTTAFSFATGLARVGKRVVVIDCDLRRPALHKAFEMRNDTGVSEYLSGLVGLDQVVRPSKFENVSLVSCGLIPPNPTELLSGPGFVALIEHLGQRFDMVIVDAPPVLGLADAVLIGAQVQSTVLVMQSGRNYRGSLKSSVARLQKAGTRIVGTVLTKQNMRNLGYGYDYAYDYKYSESSKA